MILPLSVTQPCSLFHLSKTLAKFASHVGRAVSEVSVDECLIIPQARYFLVSSAKHPLFFPLLFKTSCSLKFSKPLGDWLPGVLAPPGPE